jgi:DNA (cytosine-5)-methyltransferase 1
MIEHMVETTLRQDPAMPDNRLPVDDSGQRRKDLLDDAAALRAAPVLVDFFAGCGGTSEGFRTAGIEPVAAIDFDPEAAATYALNFPNTRVIVRDIVKLPSSAIDDVVNGARAEGRPVIFSACAPCQPFSNQRRGAAPPGDARADVLAQVLRFVRRHRPDAIFLENVPGLERRSAAYGPFRRVLRSLERGGYEVTYQTVEARRYGVSERRLRLVVIASLRGSIEFPTYSHGPGLLPYRTVREAIANLPPLEAGQAHPTMNAHRAARLSDLNRRRIEATPEGGSRRDWPDELLLDCHAGRPNSYTDAYGRLRWDEPAPALTTRCVSYSNGRFGHPVQHRAITPREAAAIQTFPDSFAFSGALTSMARQVGNAVPPKLAEVFATVIKASLTQDARIAA